MEYKATYKILIFLLCVFTASLVLSNAMVTHDVEVVEGGADAGASVIFFILVLIAAVVVLGVIKLGLSKYLYLYTEYIALVFLPLFVAVSISGSLPIGIGISLFILTWKMLFKKYFIKEIEGLIISTCIASVIGITFTPLALIVLMVLLSVYDFIAVKRTRHMITLAEDVIKKNGPQVLLFSSKTEEIVIGLADIIFPSAFAVSVALESSPLSGTLAISFSLIGLWAMFMHPSSEGMPALPYGSLGIVGYVISRLIL